MAKFSKGNATSDPMNLPSGDVFQEEVQESPLHGALEPQEETDELPSQQGSEEEVQCQVHAHQEGR